MRWTREDFLPRITIPRQSLMQQHHKKNMEGIVSKTEVLIIKVTQVSGTNGSNIMDMVIEQEKEEEGKECVYKCFDGEVLYLRQKRKWEVSLERTNKRTFTVVYHHGKINVLPSNYQFPPMTCSQLIVNFLLGIIFYNVPPLWTLSSKEVNHKQNSMIMWNMMKCFVSEVKIVAFDKVCWKAKMKDWDYMSTINVWDNVHNYFNTKYRYNNKQTKTHGKQFTIACHLQISFIIQIMLSLKIHH